MENMTFISDEKEESKLRRRPSSTSSFLVACWNPYVMGLGSFLSTCIGLILSCREGLVVRVESKLALSSSVLQSIAKPWFCSLLTCLILKVLDGATSFFRMVTRSVFPSFVGYRSTVLVEDLGVAAWAYVVFSYGKGQELVVVGAGSVCWLLSSVTTGSLELYISRVLIVVSSWFTSLLASSLFSALRSYLLSFL
ncbi:hypothetical protein HNY73_013880 [Argiope bruennichi]|uniref:Uncharacterized protein n=1 Tax=Argiope bruennichi TaxID=94029 RepID=A0A8T0ER60_ARGBR|nr:hypothetical protein HNY73_013880 [Argiope bruennichi]